VIAKLSRLNTNFRPVSHNVTNVTKCHWISKIDPGFSVLFCTALSNPDKIFFRAAVRLSNNLENMSKYRVTKIYLMVRICELKGLKPNGPAIKGGCVTRRQHRAESRYFSQKTVTVQGGYGAVFAVQVQIWLSITRVAVQIWCEWYISQRLQFLCVAMARSGFITSYEAVLGVGVKCKNCDEQLTFIVRVRLSNQILESR